jgi:hypothetical protein
LGIGQGVKSDMMEYWNDGSEIVELEETVEVADYLDGVSGEFVVNRQ